jgi:hypothetical protein
MITMTYTHITYIFIMYLCFLQPMVKTAVTYVVASRGYLLVPRYDREPWYYIHQLYLVQS